MSRARCLGSEPVSSSGRSNPSKGPNHAAKSRHRSLRDLARGPGRLAVALRVDRRLDGLDLCREGPLWLRGDDNEPGEIGQSMRIGIARDADRLLRFYLSDSPFVSGPRSLNIR